MSKSPFYKTGKSKSPLHQEESLVSKKRTTRLANKVRDAWNSPDMSSDMTSRASKKFNRKNEKFRKKTGLTNWAAETSLVKKK